MDKSESIGEITKALIGVQKELRNPHRTAENPYFNMKYAPLDEIINLVKPILTKNGLTIVQTNSTGRHEAAIYTYGKASKKGSDEHVIIDIVSVETTLLHESGEYITSKLEISPEKAGPQGVGSAIKYARRYAIEALLFIASEEDDDGENSHVRNDRKSKQPERVENVEPKRYSEESTKMMVENITNRIQNANIPQDKKEDALKKISIKQGREKEVYIETLSQRLDEMEGTDEIHE